MNVKLIAAPPRLTKTKLKEKGELRRGGGDDFSNI